MRDDAPLVPLQSLIVNDWLDDKREAKLAQRRADAADRAAHPDAWEDVADPGLEWLGPVWRRIERE